MSYAGRSVERSDGLCAASYILNQEALHILINEGARILHRRIRPMETDHAQGRITDHLANQRTYLAWLRTAFSLISLGFATNRFGQFIVELHQKEGSDAAATSAGTRRFGLGMVIFGTILIVVAAGHYLYIRNCIERGIVWSGSTMVWIVSFMAVTFGVTCIFLLWS